MSDENLAPQEREWLANPEDTVREALRDTVGDGEGIDERVFDALIARAKAEAWEAGYNACHEDYQRKTGPLLTPNPHRRGDDE